MPGGLGIGAHNSSLPATPDVVCQDCTIVGPDNAVQILYPSRYIRLKLRDCRLIVLNFSQPRGTPSSGIICSEVADPKLAHVDLEDCVLAGYKVFGTGKHTSQFSYATTGKVRAYVQFEQPVPEGSRGTSATSATLNPNDIRPGGAAIRSDQQILGSIPTSPTATNRPLPGTGGYPISCDICHQTRTDVQYTKFQTKAYRHPVDVIGLTDLNPAREITCNDCHNGNNGGAAGPDLTSQNLLTNEPADG